MLLNETQLKALNLRLEQPPSCRPALATCGTSGCLEETVIAGEPAMEVACESSASSLGDRLYALPGIVQAATAVQPRLALGCPDKVAYTTYQYG
jgi:hypothetical protein